jgi:hypothetical protein
MALMVSGLLLFFLAGAVRGLFCVLLDGLGDGFGGCTSVIWPNTSRVSSSTFSGGASAWLSSLYFYERGRDLVIPGDGFFVCVAAGDSSNGYLFRSPAISWPLFSLQSRQPMSVHRFQFS